MKTKNKKSFGIADTAVLIGFVILALALVYTALLLIFGGTDVFSLIGKDDGETVDLSFSLCVSGIDTTVYSVEPQGDDAVCGFLSVGDTFYIDGKAVGRVTHIGHADHMVKTGLDNSNGSLVYAAYPGYLDLVVTIEAQGKETDSGYVVADREIKIGAPLALSTKKAEFDATVSDVQKIDVDDADDRTVDKEG